MPASGANFSSKMLNLKEYSAFIFIILLLFCGSESQDILGCGGFVKSEVEINFSMVEVSVLEMKAWQSVGMIKQLFSPKIIIFTT